VTPPPASARSPAITGHADLILTGGRVHTVTAANDVVEAVAIGGGRVLAVGSNASVRALAGPSTREIELRGRSALPGFVDAHCHLVGLGMSRMSIDRKAAGMQSITALQAAVRQRAISHAWPRSATRTVSTGTRWRPNIR
jgi:predicted amidohydrolase YtcJ